MKFLSLILAYLSTVGIMFLYAGTFSIRYIGGSTAIVVAVLFPITLRFFYVGIPLLKKQTLWNYLGSLILFCSILVGRSFDCYGNFKLILEAIDNLLSWPTLVSFYLLITVGLSILINKLREFNDSRLEVDHNKFNLKPIALAFFSMLLLWLPLLIAFSPASIEWDGFYQINQYFKVYPGWDNHHPWTLTLLFGFLIDCGRKIVDDNFGLFLAGSVNTIITLICYSIVSYMIYRWSGSKKLFLATILFYGMLPIFPAFSQNVIKDGIYAATFTLFFASFLHFYKISLYKNHDIAVTCFLAISAFPVMFFRNEGIFVVIVGLFTLFIGLSEQRKKLILLIGASCSVFILVNAVGFQILNIKAGSVAETLSIPFQQVARVVKYSPESFSEGELESINKVINTNKIGESYNPLISDPVKAFYNRHANKQDLLAFFHTWYKVALKEPLIYLEAAVGHTYGYFYPFAWTETRSTFYNTIDPNPYINTGFFKFGYWIDQDTRAKYFSYCLSIFDLPVIGNFINPGSYFWCLIISLVFILENTKIKEGLRLILPLVVPFIALVFCCLSPVNGLVRYTLPLCASLPLMTYYGLYGWRQLIKQQVLFPTESPLVKEGKDNSKD